jgi:3-dehydroquinate dehydratase/shikimate dehydrogenase
VTGRTLAVLLAARSAAAGVDLVELRLDGVADVDVAAALAGRHRPVLITCRPAWEGGRYSGSEEARRRLLQQALALGAEFVDVESRAGFDDLVRAGGDRVVLSFHDFDGVPADLDERVRAMRASGAGTIKVAVTAGRLADTLSLTSLPRNGATVLVAMGEAGIVTRLLPARFGSRWTYAGHGVAPGQIPASRMIEEFRFQEITPRTRLYGIVSRSAIHSLSPSMHNAAFRAAGIDAVYVPLSSTDFNDFQRFADAMGIEGASITIPYKLDALRASAEADAGTRAVGAANTLKRGDGGWKATNTDVEGFLAPLSARLPGSLRGLRAAVLGGGGAARAVIVALLSQGAIVTVHARRGEQARDVADALGAAAGTWPPPPGSWDLLVNSTPLGGATHRDESPLPGGPFDGRLVYDLTYGPGESPLLREARAAGCETLDGLTMLVAQAERQFEWWTGQRPAPGVMQAAAERRVLESSGAASRVTSR